jgi:hypothetical protein
MPIFCLVGSRKRRLLVPSSLGEKDGVTAAPVGHAAAADSLTNEQAYALASDIIVRQKQILAAWHSKLDQHLTIRPEERDMGASLVTYHARFAQCFKSS